ncbi:MAG: dTDP-glucose pyrophosphorylase, partial [Paraglaciecola sp.]
MNDNWQKALLPENTLIEDAIRVLNESSLQIVLVVSNENILLGTITDGDIRRGLLKGFNLNSPINDVIQRDALVVPPDMGRDMVLQLMRANKVHQLPIVDHEHKVVGLQLWDSMSSPSVKDNLMVIMAGGLGTRLRPHTEKCPKPLLPIAGKPMLEHIIKRAKEDGFNHFILAIHYLGEMIEDYFGNGDKWQVRIEYLRETEPLGTAGALSLLEKHLSSPLLVSNGDVLTDINYAELLDFHIRHEAAATMAVRLHEWQHPFGVVRTKGVDIVSFDEKPVTKTHINAGVYVLEPNALSLLFQNEVCDMPSLFDRLSANNYRTIVYPMHEPWLDVGRPLDYENAQIQKSNSEQKL